MSFIPNLLANLFSSSAIGALNDNFNKIKAEFAKVLYTDGSAVMTGDLDMDTNRILNHPSPVSDNDLATLGAVKSVAASISRGPAGPPGSQTFPSLQATTGDRLPDFNTALATNSALALSAGDYFLSNAPISNNKTFLGFGARFTGAGPYFADEGVINASGEWASKGSDTGRADYTRVSQFVALPSGGHTRSYESAASMANLLVYDQSVYSSDGDGISAGSTTSARDYVARDCNVFVPGGLNLQRVRVWGINSFVQFGSQVSDAGTVNGSGTAAELRLDNYGGDSGRYQNTAVNKNILCVYAGGTFKATAGLYVGPGSSTGGFYNGVQVNRRACVDYVFTALDQDGVTTQNSQWGITPEGAEEFKGIPTPSTPNNGRTKFYADTNGNLRALFSDGVPRLIKSRSSAANVQDINGYDPTGSNDMAAGYQQLVNQAATAGAVVEAPAGLMLLGSTITLPAGHVFRGQQIGGLFSDPKKVSSFLIGHTGKGFTNSGGSGSTPISITDQQTIRNQPAVVSGQPWSPTDHDYDYYFPDISDLKMRRIMTLNATRGIYFNGGRNTINEWNGHCFKRGLHIDWSYDTCHVSDVHLWPFWSLTPEVATYTNANLRSFELLRVDNAFFDKIFAIGFQYGFYIDRWTNPSNNVNTPAGTTSKFKLTTADLDIGACAYYVTPAADKHTAKFCGVTAQGLDTPMPVPLLGVDGTNARITGDFDGDAAGGNVVRLGSSSAGSLVGLRIGSNSYNKAQGGGSGFPAVEVVSGGGHVDVLQGSYISGGVNGAAISAGDVTIK